VVVEYASRKDAGLFGNFVYQFHDVRLYRWTAGYLNTSTNPGANYCGPDPNADAYSHLYATAHTNYYPNTSPFALLR